MKKIKYISNYTDGTGWAKAGTYNALALSTIYDVACEERKYNESSVLLEEDLAQLLNKTMENPDYTIHHVLPVDYAKRPNTINVGFLEVEATISNQQWLKNISMMDFILVPDLDSFELLKMSGVTNVKIFPHSFNYTKTVGHENALKINELDQSYNFIFVGEFSVRKNIEALLRAFYAEFHHKEPVNLILKTNTDKDRVQSLCSAVKQQCRKNSPCKDPVLISGYLSEPELISIMRQCHSFVTASHGEAWCYPALEALACGLDVIYPYFTGIHSYAPKTFAVQSNRGRCYGAVDAVDGLYSCNDLWSEININELMKAMRRAFELGTSRKNKDLNSSIAQQYDYRNAKGAREIFG